MRQRRSDIKKNLLWTAGIILFFFVSMQVVKELKTYMEFNYKTLPFYYSLIFSYILFGFILGAPALLKRWHTNNTFNWTKFLIQGLPAIIIGFPHLNYYIYFNMELSYKYLPWLMLQHAPSGFVVNMSCIWLGKVIADSIKGKEVETLSLDSSNSGLIK